MLVTKPVDSHAAIDAGVSWLNVVQSIGVRAMTPDLLINLGTTGFFAILYQF